MSMTPQEGRSTSLGSSPGTGRRPRTPEATLPLDRPAREIAPGAVHVPDWLSVEQQRELVDACRGWAQGPVPLRAAKLPGGYAMSVQTVCLGWHWQPYRYSRTADDADGAAVAPFPAWLADLGRSALADAYGSPAAGHGYQPDAALVNYYDDNARLGMHQDKDERTDEPVVSLSIGDTCLFRFGNTDNRTKPYTDVELHSGDLFVFGGPSRFAYHGVPKVFAGTANPDTGLTTGRLNITMRVTGMT
jgi:alkylated DNA repair protein (DNA oxidative demethylase)